MTGVEPEGGREGGSKGGRVRRYVLLSLKARREGGREGGVTCQGTDDGAYRRNKKCPHTSRDGFIWLRQASEAGREGGRGGREGGRVYLSRHRR